MHAPYPPASPPASPSGGDRPARPRTRGRSLRLSRGEPAGKARARSRAGAISIVAHVVGGALLLQWLTFGHGLRWMTDERDAQRQERLTYVEPVTPPQARTASSGARASAPQGGAPRLAAPEAVPTALPAPARGDTGASGPPRARADGGIGSAAPEVRGARPDYADERVWQAPAAGYGVTRRDGADNLDSVMAWAITAARDSLDSLARAQGRTGRPPGDWTRTDKDGNRWGWDQQGIRLGKVTIPNALLGLLPLNARVGASGNYTAMERERRVSAAREDIMRMSERSMGEAEFRRVVKEMNARRDVERRDRLRAPSASVAAPVRTDGRPPAP